MVRRGFYRSAILRDCAGIPYPATLESLHEVNPNLSRKKMWIIVNKRGEQQHQFGAFKFHSDAYRVLRKAIDRMPNAGCKIKFQEEKADNHA